MTAFLVPQKLEQLKFIEMAIIFFVLWEFSNKHFSKSRVDFFFLSFEVLAFRAHRVDAIATESQKLIKLIYSSSDFAEATFIDHFLMINFLYLNSFDDESL